jgi:hypothetical protein
MSYFIISDGTTVKDLGPYGYHGTFTNAAVGEGDDITVQDHQRSIAEGVPTFEEIKGYLNTTYLKKGSVENEKTASEIAAISSIKNVSPGGSLSVDVNELLKAYSSLTNDKELAELVKKLSELKNQTLSPSESTAILKTVFEILNNLKNLPRSRRNFSLAKPPVAQKPLNISEMNGILSMPQRVKMNLPKQSIRLSYEWLMPFLYIALAFIILFIYKF